MESFRYRSWEITLDGVQAAWPPIARLALSNGWLRQFNNIPTKSEFPANAIHMGGRCREQPEQLVRAGEWSRTMKKLATLLTRLLSDETGGEVLEYALIAGLIVIAAISAITSVGSKVLARWTSLNHSM